LKQAEKQAQADGKKIGPAGITCWADLLFAPCWTK
jgi:hypothetical protein